METNDKAKILVVDDTIKNVQLLGNLLSNEGYTVEFALSGKEALEWLEDEMFDLILLDVMMPEMDGFETCSIIKKTDKIKDIPIIFLTAKTETESIEKGFKVGAVDYLTKPFNHAELLIRVENHIKFQMAKKMLVEEKEYQAVKAMVVTANHNMNQMLSVMQGNIEMIQMYEEIRDNEDIMKKFNRVKTALKNMANLLRKMDKIEEVKFVDYTKNIKMVDID